MSLLSAPGSVLTTLIKSPVEALRCCPDRALVKTSTTIVAGRQRDAQMIEVLRAYTLLR